MEHSSEYSQQNQMTREKDQNIRIRKHGAKEEKLHTLSSSLHKISLKRGCLFSVKNQEPVL